MGWKITRDFYFESKLKEYGTIENIPDYMNHNAKGKEGNGYKGKDVCRVKTWDDDGNLYYEAVCDGEASAEAFHDWSQYDSGSVASKIKMKGGKWENFIS